MTGLECLQTELIKRGCTKSQAEAKAIPIVLDIIANTDHNWEDYETARKSLILAKAQLQNERYSFERDKRDFENWKTAECGRINAARKEIDERKKSFRELLDNLDNFETPEFRDRFRLAHFFMDNANPDQKSRTVYVYWLGAILGGGMNLSSGGGEK